MPRRNWFLDSRLALRTERAELIRLLRSRAVSCSVGPAEPGGWVVVAMDPGAKPDPLAAELSRSVSPLIVTTAVNTGKDRLELRAWKDGSSAAEFTWRRGGKQLPSMQGIATAIGALPVGLPAEPTQLPPGHGEVSAVDLLERIVDLLSLPPTLVDRLPDKALVLYRGELTEAHFIAAVAGPTWLMATESGWQVLAPAEDPDVRHPLSARAAGLAAGLSSFSRRLGTVLIWRDGQNGCGYSLWHKGHAVDLHCWNSPWESLPGTGVDDQIGDAALLAQAIGQPDQTVLLRALLRRRAEPAELLDEFTSTAVVPTECGQLLLDQVTPGHLATAQLIERTSPGRAVMTHAKAPLLADSSRSRRPLLNWTILALSIATALFCGLLTVIGIAVLATNGAFVDESGRTAGDWWQTALAAALTAGATWSAIARLHSLRRPKPSKVDTPG